MFALPTAAHGPSIADWHSVTMEDSWYQASLPSSTFPSSPSHSPSTLSALAALTRGRRTRRPGKLAAGDSLSPLTPHLYPRTPFCSPTSSPHPLNPPSPLPYHPSSSSPSPPSSSAHPLSTPQSKRKVASSSSTLTISISPHSTRSHSMPYLSVSDLFISVDGQHSARSPDSAVIVATPFSSPYSPLKQDAPLSPLLLSSSPVSPSPFSRLHQNSPAGAFPSPLLQPSPCAGSPLSAAFDCLPSSFSCSPAPSTPAEWSAFLSSVGAGEAGELHVPSVLKSPVSSPVVAAMTPHPSPLLGGYTTSQPSPERSLLSQSSSLLFEQLASFSLELQHAAQALSTEEEKRPVDSAAVDNCADSEAAQSPRVIIRVSRPDEQSSGSEANSDSD